MNAIQFIQKHGVDKAREVLSGAPQNAVYYWQIPRCKYCVYSSNEQKQGRVIVLEELKRLVESVDLVNLKGGVKKLKKEADCLFHNEVEGVALRYEQAIADYELLFCSGESK